MKLLSISGMHHDLNISYYDGTKLHYMKLERQTQIKHYNEYYTKDYDISCLNIDLLENFVSKLMTQYYPNIKFNINDVEAICVDNNISYANNLDLIKRNEDLWFKYKNIYVVDHHLLHALSTHVTDKVKENYDCYYVLDARGGQYSYSVFKTKNLEDSNTLNFKRINSSLYKNGSLGQGIISLGRQLEIKGSPLDVAGKFIGLQSYGKIDPALYGKLNTEYNNLANLQNNIEFSTNGEYGSLGLFDLAGYSNKLNAAHTIHYWAGKQVVNLFSKYSSKFDRISYSGGVAQNIIWNTELKTLYTNLDIFPHCADEGLSLGGIEFLRRFFKISPITLDNFPFSQTDQGPDNLPDDTTLTVIAEQLAKGKTVAWYQGNGEIGPRALGNRSILMDPRIKDGKQKINQIKNREYYRPFGASILTEFSMEYFNLKFANPFMLYLGETLKSGLDSIMHVDRTCRVQTVDLNTVYFRVLLEKFYNITNCPVLLNTSLNLSGKPIAGTTQAALNEYNKGLIDILVIGNKIYNHNCN